MYNAIDHVLLHWQVERGESFALHFWEVLDGHSDNDITNQSPITLNIFLIFWRELLILSKFECKG